MIQESSSHLNAERIEGLPKQWSMMLQFQSLSQTQLGNTRHLTPASKCLQSSLEILRRFSGNLACVLLGAWMTVISIGLSQSCLQLLRQGWGSACPLDNTGRTAVWATVHEFPTALRLSEPGALAEASPSRDGLIQIQERNIRKKDLKHL